MRDRSNKSRPGEKGLPGISLSSLAITLAAMLVMALLIQWEVVVLNRQTLSAEHTIAPPAILAFVAVSLLLAAITAITRYRLLTRSELLGVVYALLLAAPFMTQAFWHRIVAITASVPQNNETVLLDLINDKLWPHGPNLLQDAFDPESVRLERVGQARLETLEVEPGRTFQGVVLENDDPEQRSLVRVHIPLQDPDAGPDTPWNVPLGEPYLVNAQVRPGTFENPEIPPDSRYFIRMSINEQAGWLNVLNSNRSVERTATQQRAFALMGVYGVELTGEPGETMVLEFGLSGEGRVSFAAPKMLNVMALESINRGRQVVSRETYEQLPPDQRGGLVVRPDNLWSLAGLRFLLSANIPLRAWAGPFLWWAAFILILALASLSIGVIFRRQWMDNERFQIPMSRVPTAFVGEPEGEDGTALPPIWKNRVMWAGFATAMAWSLLRGWHFYNPNVPNTDIDVPLSQYFQDPGWGKTWQPVTFTVIPIFLSLAIFMELSVLISLVVGYFLYRMQFWFGQSAGLDVFSRYPFPNEQQTGGYVIYALLIITFTRRYLWSVLKAAVKGDREASRGEALSYRSAWGGLILALAAGVLWAQAVGVNWLGMLTFLGILLVVTIVAARLRTECGVPFSYLAFADLPIILALLGGATSFGPEAMMFCFIAAFFLGTTPFFLMPGAQLEALELGRRYRMRPTHLPVIIMVGVLGGLLIGGWVFLGGAYSAGGDEMAYRWAFEDKLWQFTALTEEINEATAAMNGKADQNRSSFNDPSTYGYFFGGAFTAVVAILRQLFAGFWFHPIGVLLGMTWMLSIIWGSCLAAWMIRGLVLYFGGAATVRTKLQPYFIGFFLGSATAAMLLTVHAAWLRSQGIDEIYRALP